MNKISKRTYALLYLGIVIYSLTSVSNKIAAGYPILSFLWMLFYGLGILAMGGYAIIWQKVLKNIPLTTAYANRAVATILGLIWGVLFFGERVSLRIIIGALIVVSGVVIITGDEYEK